MAIQSNTVQLNSIYKKCHKECVPLPSHHHSLATMIMIIFLRWSLTMIVMVVANEFTNKPWEVNWTQVKLLKVRISTNCWIQVKYTFTLDKYWIPTGSSVMYKHIVRCIVTQSLNVQSNCQKASPTSDLYFWRLRFLVLFPCCRAVINKW